MTLRENELGVGHTRVMLQRGFAICGLDLICSRGLFDPKDSVWFANRGFDITELFVFLVRCHSED